MALIEYSFASLIDCSIDISEKGIELEFCPRINCTEAMFSMMKIKRKNLSIQFFEKAGYSFSQKIILKTAIIS